MIDREKFNDLFTQLDKEIVKELIDIFLSEFDERFRKLRKNVEEKDFEQLRFNAHSLKGVIAYFVDPVTIELSGRLDRMAKNNTTEGLDEVYRELEKNSVRLSEELKIISKDLTS